MISERTRAALAAYKARGGQLGAALAQCRNLTPQAREKGSAAAAAARTRNAAAGGQPLRIIELANAYQFKLLPRRVTLEDLTSMR